MTTEQHEALRIADHPGTSYSAAEMLRASHALIVQMAEALEENHAYIFNHSQSDDFKRYDEAMYAATQYLTRGPKP